MLYRVIVCKALILIHYLGIVASGDTEEDSAVIVQINPFIAKSKKIIQFSKDEGRYKRGGAEKSSLFLEFPESFFSNPKLKSLYTALIGGGGSSELVKSSNTTNIVFKLDPSGTNVKEEAKSRAKKREAKERRDDTPFELKIAPSYHRQRNSIFQFTPCIEVKPETIPCEQQDHYATETVEAKCYPTKPNASRLRICGGITYEIDTKIRHDPCDCARLELPKENTRSEEKFTFSRSSPVIATQDLSTLRWTPEPCRLRSHYRDDAVEGFSTIKNPTSKSSSSSSYTTNFPITSSIRWGLKRRQARQDQRRDQSKRACSPCCPSTCPTTCKTTCSTTCPPTRPSTCPTICNKNTPCALKRRHVNWALLSKNFKRSCLTPSSTRIGVRQMREAPVKLYFQSSCNSTTSSCSSTCSSTKCSSTTTKKCPTTACSVATCSNPPKTTRPTTKCTNEITTTCKPTIAKSTTCRVNRRHAKLDHRFKRRGEYTSLKQIVRSNCQPHCKPLITPSPCPCYPSLRFSCSPTPSPSCCSQPSTPCRTTAPTCCTTISPCCNTQIYSSTTTCCPMKDEPSKNLFQSFRQKLNVRSKRDQPLFRKKRKLWVYKPKHGLRKIYLRADESPNTINRYNKYYFEIALLKRCVSVRENQSLYTSVNLLPHGNTGNFESFKLET